jgi:hypothetical protein
MTVKYTLATLILLAGVALAQDSGDPQPSQGDSNPPCNCNVSMTPDITGGSEFMAWMNQSSWDAAVENSVGLSGATADSGGGGIWGQESPGGSWNPFNFPGSGWTTGPTGMGLKDITAAQRSAVVHPGSLANWGGPLGYAIGVVGNLMGLLCQGPMGCGPVAGLDVPELGPIKYDFSGAGFAREPFRNVVGTSSEFELVEGPPTEFRGKPYLSNSPIKALGGEIHSSTYWEDVDQGGMTRKSDHWGKLNTTTYDLKGIENMPGAYQAGGMWILPYQVTAHVRYGGMIPPP